MKKAVVISLGGSLIVTDKINIEFLNRFKALIIDFINKGNCAAIVCGGGNICRAYQGSAEILGVKNRKDLDWIGISATKLNAELIRAMFGDEAYEFVLDDPSVVPKTNKRIIVGSGYLPGSSSDLDAVLLAKALGTGVVINMTDVDYVYDKDPKKFKDAKALNEIRWRDFRKIIGCDWIPGSKVPFDPAAAEHAEKFKIKVVVLNGKNFDNLNNCLEDKEFVGTIIR